MERILGDAEVGGRLVESAEASVMAEAVAVWPRKPMPGPAKRGISPESIFFFNAAPCSSVSVPAATAASTRAFIAFSIALDRALGVTPSSLAASVTIFWLSSFGSPSFVAARAAPPPATASAATAPMAIMRVLLRVIRQSPLDRVVNSLQHRHLRRD